jgi:hypothetical protein
MPPSVLFLGAANDLIGKLGTGVNEDVLLHLISSKCIPILIYGAELLKLDKACINSLDFTVVRFSNEDILELLTENLLLNVLNSLGFASALTVNLLFHVRLHLLPILKTDTVISVGLIVAK